MEATGTAGGTLLDEEEEERRRAFALRINLFFFLTFALFSVLLIKLSYLQFVDGNRLDRMLSMSLRRDVVIPPIRGNIYDRNGAPIAYTTTSQSLFYQWDGGSEPAQYAAAARLLESIISQYGKPDSRMTAAEIIKLMDVGCDLDGNRTKPMGYKFAPRRIKTNLTNTEMAVIAERRDILPGFEITEESTRVYNPDRIAVQLIGFMRTFSTAKSNIDFYKETELPYLNDEYVGYDGLELLYEDELRGESGRKTYPVNAHNRIIGQKELTAPVKGHNLYLTLDKDVQKAAEQAIADHLRTLRASRPDSPFYKGKRAVSGYAVAIEVNTGRIAAMASVPDYDPNVWIGRLSQKDYESIQNLYPNGTIRDRQPDLPQHDLPKHPSSMVPPGSVLKPLTILIGLKEGLIRPRSSYNDEGVFYYGKDNNSRVSNSDSTSWGSLTPVTALQHSSNTFMAAMVGNPLYMMKPKPLDLWHSYMTQFGLGVPTRSDLAGESEGIADYYRNAKKSSPQAALVQATYGQMARYTTLQLAQYASMLANRGKRYKPLFVDRISTYEGEPIHRVEPELLNEVKLPASYWRTVEEGMRRVTAVGFDDAFGATVARKTGTSEQQVAGGQKIDNAVFIAYAPVGRPKLAVAVVVPEGGFGARGAAPIARRIFDAYDKVVGLHD